jgi:hypothetical protein
MSEIIDNYLEKYNVGFPTFEKLFNLKSDRLIEVLQDICSDHTKASELLTENPNVTKTIENDMPTKIRLSSWDGLEILPTGINFIPEHGSGYSIVLFNKFFTLNLD